MRATVLAMNAFQSFGQIDLLTKGGPNDRTRVLVYAIFQEVRRGDPSTAAAQAVALFGILFLLEDLGVLELKAVFVLPIVLIVVGVAVLVGSLMDTGRGRRPEESRGGRI